MGCYSQESLFEYVYALLIDILDKKEFVLFAEQLDMVLDYILADSLEQSNEDLRI